MSFELTIIITVAVFALLGAVGYFVFKSFNILVIFLSLSVSFLVWGLWMGMASNFKDGALRHEPMNILGIIHTGGPLVGALMACLLVAVTFIIERLLSINRAQGSGDTIMFLKGLQTNLEHGNVRGAIGECEKRRGAISNIMRNGLERYEQVENDKEYGPDKKLAEVQRAIDEAVNLETPLLEKNLVILSTVSSIATMIGLLGTTVGMIRAFAALGAAGGAVSAQALSTGISEALYNTAFGLFAAIVSIIAYNFFSSKVDNFVYMIDEAILSVMEILTIKVKK